MASEDAARDAEMDATRVCSSPDAMAPACGASSADAPDPRQSRREALPQVPAWSTAPAVSGSEGVGAPETTGSCGGVAPAEACAEGRFSCVDGAFVRVARQPKMPPQRRPRCRKGAAQVTSSGFQQLAGHHGAPHAAAAFGPPGPQQVEAPKQDTSPVAVASVPRDFGPASQACAHGLCAVDQTGCVGGAPAVGRACGGACQGPPGHCQSRCAIPLETACFSYRHLG